MTFEKTTPDLAPINLEPTARLLIATIVLDEADKLRKRAREIKNIPPPPPPGNDRTEVFAKLWREAWEQEVALSADRLCDAAHLLEDAATNRRAISQTQDLLEWRKR